MRKVLSIRNLVFLFIAVAFYAVPAYPADEGPAKITDIQVAGNKKVEAETIRSKMSIKVGDAFSPSRVRNDIAAIYKMGYFDDVKVDAEGYAGGLRLIVNVVERPIISSFTFEGNKKLDASKLREKVNLTPYSIYNPALVEENVEKLKLFYQGEGYYNAEVVPVVKRTDREVKVIFQIDEGQKVVIRKIRFVGNDRISARKIRKAMSTKKYIWGWSWLMKTGTYKLADFEQDMERIKALYYNNGYIQVAVGEPKVELSPDKRYLDITIPIHEGEQFRYRDITVTGNKVFTSQELLKKVTSKRGEIMNRDKLKGDIVTLTDMYGSRGYAFASISPVIKPDVEKKEVDVDLDVSEGSQIFVDRINISGNVKTRDKVIRRELKFNEQEIYDTTSLKRTYERLKNLDFFEDVEITPERKEGKNMVDLNVKVKEKSTGSFSIGGGYSTIDRMVALGEVTQNNFLGLGQMVKFKGEFGKRRQNYVLSFMEPWLLDMPMSLRLDLYKEERVYNGYSKRSTGGTVSLGRRFWEYFGATLSYGYADERYFDVDPSVEGYLGENEKLHITSKLGLSLYRDSRNNILDPRSGGNHSIYAEVASRLLGSQNRFYKVVGETTWYFPFYFDTAFSVHAMMGYGTGLEGKSMPLFERFYVGGIGTVRGFTWGAIGPKSGGTPIGGNKELVLNGEYTFPLVPDIKLRGVVFADAGAAFDDDEGYDFSKIRYSAGGGFRWLSPVGLIRLEYGYVLDRKQGEGPGRWEFSMGSLF